MNRDPRLTVTALATGDTETGNQVLIAAGAFGMAFSHDAGISWQRPFAADELPAITDLAVSQGFHHNGKVYVGTADGCLVCSASSQSCRPVLGDGHVFALAVTPSDRESPLDDATEIDQVFVGTDVDGLFASRDGGERWEARNAGLLDLSILAFAASPAFTLDRTAYVGTTTGIQRSRNGGRAWRALELPAGDAAVQSIVLSPDFARNQQLFAGTEDAGLYVSQDAGDSWTQVPALGEQTINVVAISPTSGTVAAGTDRAVYLSNDAGATWRENQYGIGAALALCWLTEKGDEWLCAGLFQQGVARSRDRGTTWVMVDPTGDS